MPLTWLLRHRGSTHVTGDNRIWTCKCSFTLSFNILSRWSHADLIKMAHVTAKGDPAKEAVLDVCVRGFDSVKKKLDENPGPDTTKIMDYIDKVRKLKAVQPSKANKGVWDPQEAVYLMKEHSWDIDHLPTEQLREPAVWEVSQESSI